MKNKRFIIYNIILFIIFGFLTIYTLEGRSDLPLFSERAILIFGLSGILSQLYLINKNLIKKDK